MRGICCGCQSPVDLQYSSLPLHQLLELGQDEEEIHREYGDSISYVCVSHDAWGERCDGSGLVPQVVLKDTRQ